MAISPLSAISNATAFIQPPQPLAQLARQELFARALESSIGGPPVAPAALAASATQPELISSLERALFRDLALQIARADAGGLTALLDRSLTSLLGLGGALPEGLPPILADAGTQQSMAFASSLTGLLSTLQLLGSDAGEEPALIDLLA